MRPFLFVPVAYGSIYTGVPASMPVASPGSDGDRPFNWRCPSYDRTGDYVIMAGMHPWSPFWSPVPWLIGMFFVGYLLMRYVHWKYADLR